MGHNKPLIAKQYDYLVVGAGLYGAVFAHELSKNGKKCLVIDKRNHTGGNIYCENIQGINVHKYGAHIFHTDNKTVWDYVNQFVEFNSFVNSPIANFKGRLFNLPFNMNTFHRLWGVKTPEEARLKIEQQRNAYKHIGNPANLEEQALVLGGEDIYETLIKGYSEKQWGRPATEIPAFIIRRLPFRFTFDNNYYNCQYQGIPKGGYNALINRLLSGIEVRTETNYFSDREYFGSISEKILYTGKIDAFFNYCFGKLAYRSLHFETEVLDVDNYQGVAVMNFTDRETPFTRIIEHKHFEFGSQPETVISREYPHEFSTDHEPYYPLNDTFNQAILTKYQALAGKHPGLILGGRLAEYRYYDMHQVIAAALEKANAETSS